MKRTIWSSLLIAAALLLGTTAAFGQSGPTAGGSTGGFTITNGYSLPAGEWSAGWYVNNWDYDSAQIPVTAPSPFQGYETMGYNDTAISLSLGYGLSKDFELFASIPWVELRENKFGTQGVVDGVLVRNKFKENGIGPIHFGGKYSLWRSSDSMLHLGLYAGADAPTRAKNHDDPIQTGKWDLFGGVAFTARFITFDVNYTHRGDRYDFKVPDELRAGLGVEIPASRNTVFLWEVNHLDFVDNCKASPFCREPRAQTGTTAGVRWFFNDSVALNAGVRLNLTQAFSRNDGDHNPLGWVAGVTYFPRKSFGDSTWGDLNGRGRKKPVKAVPPSAPIITVPTNGATVTIDRPSVAGTADPNALVKLALDGAPAGEATAGPTGAWSTTVGPVTEGEHALAATQTDPKTNLTSEPSAATKFVYAKPAPPPPPPPPQPVVTTDTIQFEGNSSRIDNIAKAVLDQVALRLKSKDSATAAITGYTDSKEQKADKLSLARAEAAKQYLVKRHGIDPARVTTQGKGTADPAGDNKTKDGRKQNRRDVIVVTVPG
jgi:OOP family OmpA-OmpF porin